MAGVKCRGHKTNGDPCPNWAMHGQKVCHAHGGRAAQNRRAAHLRLAESEARILMHTYGRKIETTPTEALLDEVKWTAGHVAWLRERVQELEQDAADSLEDPDGTVRPGGGRHPLVWGVTRIKTGGDDYGTTEEAMPNIFLRLYQEERAHLARICADAIRCGIEERRVKLAEQQGQLVADVIRKILGDLNLTPEQQARVPEVVPMRLRALAG